MVKYIQTETKEGMTTIKLNYPQALNALHPDLIEALVKALLAADEDSETRVIILTGNGKAFCAGGDLAYLEALSDVRASKAYIAMAGNLIKTIKKMRKPVIAMVNGVAAGAGFNLVLACDIIICAKSAKFAQSFSKIGLIPDCGGSLLLPKAVGMQKAKEWMFTGEIIPAEKAFTFGFINHLVEDDELIPFTESFAKKLSKAAPLSLSFIKEMLENTENVTLDQALSSEETYQSLCIQTEDYKEGVKAFKEKRRPEFMGR